nr:DUF4214 domain-containing protein [Pseudomonas sp.]
MQYNAPSTAGDITDALADNPSITASTQAAILAILGLEAGAGTADIGTWDGTEGGAIVAPGDTAPDMLVVDVAGNEGDNITVDIPDVVLANTQAYVFNTDANLTVSFNTVERVIVSGNGDDLITVNGDKNTTLDGSDGDDTLITSGGDDSVTGGVGDDSVSTGAGDDTIVTGLGDDTIDGGEGFDIVETSANRADVTLSIDEDGNLVLSSEGSDSQLSNVEFIQLADDTIALADNETDATTLQLYQGVLGRSSEAAGADYWLDYEADSYYQIANHFLHSEEFTEAYGDFRDMSDEAFVDHLYANALGRDADEAGQAYWVAELASGQDRAVVAVNIVGSAEANDNIDSVFLLGGQA